MRILDVNLHQRIGMVWRFSRGGERLTCEVRWGDSGYEVALRRPDGLELIYHADTSSELIESMHKVPRALRNQGTGEGPRGRGPVPDRRQTDDRILRDSAAGAAGEPGGAARRHPNDPATLTIARH